MDPVRTLLDRLKTEARHLQRAAKRIEPSALVRLRKLPELRGLADDALQQTLQRRHCLSVVARELGLSGWSHAVAVLSRPETEDFGTLLYPPGCSAHWNIWSASYDEARQIRSEHGGYLLPYKHQFVIVDRDFIDTLGLDPEDDDWTRIGRDWPRAADLIARQRLCAAAVRSRMRSTASAR